MIEFIFAVKITVIIGVVIELMFRTRTNLKNEMKVGLRVKI